MEYLKFALIADPNCNRGAFYIQPKPRQHQEIVMLSLTKETGKWTLSQENLADCVQSFMIIDQKVLPLLHTKVREHFMVCTRHGAILVILDV